MGWSGAERRGGRVKGGMPAPAIYRCCRGGPAAVRGVILVARQLVLFESPDRGLPQRVVVSDFCDGAGLAARALGQREVLWLTHFRLARRCGRGSARDDGGR